MTLVEFLRSMRSMVADTLWRWGYDSHRPVDVMGDQSRAYCLTCREDWPCKGTRRLDEARAKAGHEWRS